MKKIKNILIIFIIILSVLFMFPENVHAELTQEQQKTVADFAKRFVNEGNNKKILRYSQPLRTIGFSNKTKRKLMYFDCSSFASFVYNKTCNAGLGCLDTPGLYNSPKFKRISYSKNALQKGDLLCRPRTASRGGHVMIYVGDGKVAHASGSKGKGPTEQVVIGNVYNDGFTILRYKGSPKNVKGYETYTWPDGTASNWNDEGTGDFDYEGTQEGTFSAQTYDFEFILDTLAQILDWFIGIVTYVIRMVFIGYTSLLEIVIDDIAGWVAGEEMSLTIEKLVNNKVPLLDVNFFNFATAGGQKIEQDSIIYVIRETIVVIYYIIRTVSIIGLLITLLYLGIRMALSNIAEEKAKYKQMLVSWLVSFIIVFFIHYIMIAILAINTSLIELINASFGGAEESLYDSVRAGSYAIQASIGWSSLVMYMILVYLLLRFLFIYIKRFLVVAILTFMAPILGVTYSIDKIKDNKSQSFTNWLREYTFNVLLQSVHVLLYTVFVSLAFKMAGTSVMGTIMAVLLINFMFKAEVILKKIFGIKSGSIKDAIKSTAVIMGAGKIAKGFMKMNIKATKVVAKPITKPISNIYNKTKDYKRIDKIRDVQKSIEEASATGKSTVKVGKNVYNIGELTKSNNIDSNTIAEGLVDKETKIKDKNKEEIKARMSQTLSSVLGTAQLAAAIPMTIADGTEGLAMASNATKNLKKGINSYSKQNEKGIYDNKKYKGKSKVIKNARNKVMNGMTLGTYGAIKNIRALGESYNKNINKNINNTQHEIAINKLEENIAKEYAKLINNPDIDRNELEEVLKSENKTIPKEAIEKVIYKISAMREIELLVNVNDEKDEIVPSVEDTQKLDSNKEKNNKGKVEKTKEKKDKQANKTNKVITVSKELNKLKQKAKKEVKTVFKKENVKFNEERFNKSIDNQIKNIIAKEEKVKKSQITEKDIQERFINMNDSEKQKIIKNAIYSSITVPKSERSNLKGKNTGMNMKDINEIIDKIAEEKTVSMERENCRGNFEVYIKENIAKQKNKEVKDVTKEEIDDHVSKLTNEKLVDYITEVGTYEDSIKRDENATKVEYSDLVESIKELRYHQESMKGN